MISAEIAIPVTEGAGFASGLWVVQNKDAMIELNPRIVEAVEQFGESHLEIVGVFVFGSAATGKTHSASDVDVAVLVEDAFLKERRALPLVLDYVVELEPLLGSDVDVVVLNTASPLLRHQVFKKGILVFARDHRRIRRFIGDALVEFLDEIVLLERLQKRAIERQFLGR